MNIIAQLQKIFVILFGDIKNDYFLNYCQKLGYTAQWQLNLKNVVPSNDPVLTNAT